jgi:hypothetical protein
VRAWCCHSGKARVKARRHLPGSRFHGRLIRCAKDASPPSASLPTLQQYWPGLLEICQDADELGRSLVEEWLCAYMFKDLVDPVRSTRARAVADFFADSDRHKSHSRPIDRAEAGVGVVIDNLEDSQELQDAVLSVHHATLITLQSTPSAKIIENDLGRSFVVPGSIKHHTTRQEPFSV